MNLTSINLFEILSFSLKIDQKTQKSFDNDQKDQKPD